MFAKMRYAVPYFRTGFFRNYNANPRLRQKLKVENEIREKAFDKRVFIEGQEIEGFKIESVQEMVDFQCQVIRLRHLATGARYIHIDKNDPNNVFAIGFRTTPFDSTGLPHILEHVTLCGSEKYPCRDPFFKMLNRSMATYMNASTGPDFTVYPFSTQHPTDYYNLMSVYLDAVFKPQLREFDFKQEGWRLEHEDTNNPRTPIVFKGVVYNEMKGVFSDNQSIYTEGLLNNLLPSHTYGVISGGDPCEIPNLAHSDLVEFHKRYYHPSNCRMYSYGNLPLTEHLKFINDSYLSSFSVTENYSVRTSVPSETRWNEPKKISIYGRHDPLAADESKQSILSASFLCTDIANAKENFTLKILSELLLVGPNSKFYKTLIEPNIGSGFSSMTGFWPDLRDTVFSVGLQGISSSDFGKVDEIINKTFCDCVREGFDEKNIENVLHSVELGMKHHTADFGLFLLWTINATWNHEGNVEELFRVNDRVSSFRKELKENPRLLQTAIERYFALNQHRLTLTMSPDEKYQEKLDKVEATLLANKLANLSREDQIKVYQDGLALREEQNKIEDPSCLPTLSTNDIKDEIDKIPLEFAEKDGIPIQLCFQPTNGVSYFRSVIDTSRLSNRNKQLLPIFADVLCLLGTKKYDFKKFDQIVHLNTGGLNVTTHVADDIYSSKYQEGLVLSSYCLDRNVERMFELWTEIFNEVSLEDVDRFSTLVRMEAGDLVNGIADCAHSYAMSKAASIVDDASAARELYSGMTFVMKMKELAQMESLESVLNEMRNVANVILGKTSMKCSANLLSSNAGNTVKSISNFIAALNDSNVENVKEIENEASKSNEIHYILPYSVNYAAWCVKSVHFAHADYAPLRVLSRLLTMRYLLPRIRERYGAYGAGVSLSPSGVLQFYSYRDPNSESTFRIFEESGDWVGKSNFTDRDIEEAKLGVFQRIDTPEAPNSKGMRQFLYGISDEVFEQHRIAVKNTSRTQLYEVACRYLSPGDIPSARVLIGPENNYTNDWERIV